MTPQEAAVVKGEGLGFTPGPWLVSVEAGDEWWFGAGQQAVIRPANGKSYDSVAVLGGDTPTELADTRLIAAAPALYEALEKARDKFRHYEDLHRVKCTAEGDEKADRNREMADLCDAALAQAGGQS